MDYTELNNTEEEELASSSSIFSLLCSQFPGLYGGLSFAASYLYSSLPWLSCELTVAGETTSIIYMYIDIGTD